jgi:UDP-glucose 4-epimerase
VRRVEPPRSIGITGGAGFIGSHLTERLVTEGREVVAVDDLSHGDVANLAGCFDRPGFGFAEIDCRDRRELGRAFAGCEAIVHLAGEKIPRYGGAVQTLEANADGARSSYEVALRLGARVILGSTSDVYGNAPSPLSEDAELTLGPPGVRRWAYATSKLFAEHLGLALASERGLPLTILRLFGAYGPRNHPSWWGGPQAAFAENLLDGRPMEIHGDGRQVRSFTYVDDTVDAFVRALDAPLRSGEVVNVGSNTPTTVLELAALVQAAAGIPGPLRVVHVPYESFGGSYQDVRRRIPDTRKARRLLGFEARTGLEEGLGRTVAWHGARRTARTAAAVS